MRLIRFLAFCAWAAPFLAHADQTGQIMAGSADFSYDLVAHITTDLKSALTTSEIAELGGEIQGEGNRVHRYIVDRANRTYFGYDLVHVYQEASDARGLYPTRQRLVGIEPLTITPQPARYFAGDGPLKLLPLPGYPAPRMVADGDTIAVDLLSSDGRPKMVDHIQISIKPDPPPAGPNLVPRDFTLDDGPLSLKFAIPFTFFVNGRPHSLGWHIAGGSMMWLALPGRGSYVLSLTPCEGNFKKSGAIRDHVITFQADGDHYELRTSGPILGSGGAWNLYMFPEPSVDPKGPLFGIEDWKCGDPSQWWIPNSPTKSSH